MVSIKKISQEFKSLNNKAMVLYKVRIEHKTLGFYSFYEIEANNYHDAELNAKRHFKDEFCNADTSLVELNAFTIDKHNVEYLQANSLFDVVQPEKLDAEPHPEYFI
jgi:hypothetical protein